MSRFKKYSEYISEKQSYINLDDVKNDKVTLGSLDTEKDKAKINQIKNILLPDLKEPLEAFLKKKIVPSENFIQIKSLIERHFIGEDPEKLIQFLTNPDVVGYDLKVTDGGHIPTADVINYYSEMFTPDFFKELIELEGKGKPVVGRNELFYILMLNNFTNSTSGGDVIGNNQKIEVKQKKGRFGGTKGTIDGVTSKDQVAYAFQQYYEVRLNDSSKGFGAKTVKAIIDAYKEANVKKPNPDFLKDLIKALANYDEKYIKTALTAPGYKFLESILRSGDDKSLRAYISALHLLGYTQEENFDWLFTMTDDRKHICMLMTKGKDIKNLHKFCNTYFSNSIGWANAAPDRPGASIGNIKV